MSCAAARRAVRRSSRWGVPCAEIKILPEWMPADGPGSTVTLYAGGGIMPASQPHLELAETSAKFRTLLRAMGMTTLPTG